MTDLVLKVPLGPTIALGGQEMAGLFRHRYMLFLYFAAACLGLIGSAGTWEDTPPEITLSFAALEVMAGVVVMVLLVLAQRGWAQRTGRLRVVDLGWLVFAATLTAVGTAEFCDRVLLGLDPTPKVFLASQFVFYLILAELMMSVLMQFTLPLMLADLRRRSEDAPPLAAARPEPEA